MKISLGMEITYHLDEISGAAIQFLAQNISNKVIAFHGEMGAGKTTFIHEICRHLNVQNNVSSPTFSIINEYISESGEIFYHMDLYRVKDEREAAEAGVEECFQSGRMCFVEWPDKAPGLLPEQTVHCTITPLSAEVRKLQIKL